MCLSQRQILYISRQGCLGFAAIRLAVLEELESEEDIIFDQKPRPSKTRWFLDLKSGPEGTQCDHGARRDCKVTGNAHSDVAFSSPLVRESLCQEEDVFGSDRI